MRTEVRQLVQAIHDSPYRIVLVTAGAGTQALSELLGVAGATRTLIEALVPYSEAAFDEFLGQKPTQYVAADTARLMAGRAFTRARWLNRDEAPVVGVACTATIVTDRPKRGDHRAHIALWQPERLRWYELNLKKGARDRMGEEDLVSSLILKALAEACDIDQQLQLPLIKEDELANEVSDFAAMTRRLYEGELDRFCVEDNGLIHTNGEPCPKAILCGAFNPLHEGHLALARSASTILQHPVSFELSAVNADKPPLPPKIILDRMAQVAGRWSILASAAPTFVQKARLYPGTTFVVGFDTAERILQPRYYNHSEANLLAALNEIREHGCRFLVAGRVDADGDFRHLQDMDIPSAFAELFHPIPDSLFRHDISSTALRQTGQRGSR
jgi:hypothetical protein